MGSLATDGDNLNDDGDFDDGDDGDDDDDDDDCCDGGGEDQDGEMRKVDRT